jgi:hypothetical protein
MRPVSVGSFLLLGTLWAQQPVPEILFDSAPNFFKLPADMHFGESAELMNWRVQKLTLHPDRHQPASAAGANRER